VVVVALAVMTVVVVRGGGGGGGGCDLWSLGSRFRDKHYSRTAATAAFHQQETSQSRGTVDVARRAS